MGRSCPRVDVVVGWSEGTTRLNPRITIEEFGQTLSRDLDGSIDTGNVFSYSLLINICKSLIRSNV